MVEDRQPKYCAFNMYIAVTLKSVYDVSVANGAIPIFVSDHTSILAQEIVLEIHVATCIASVSIPGTLNLTSCMPCNRCSKATDIALVLELVPGF